RQVDSEAAASANVALHCDLAAEIVHEAIADGEAEPGAAAPDLGREERLEDVLEHLLRYPGPGVAHLDRHTPVAGAPRRERDLVLLLGVPREATRRAE